MKENTFYIYVIKNNKGKFVSNLTNPRHKYFDKLQESTKLKAKSTNCKIYKEKICGEKENAKWHFEGYGFGRVKYLKVKRINK